MQAKEAAQAAESGAGAQAGPSAAQDDNVVDAEVKEVKKG
jgi:molecular chaperone DnaK